MSDWDILSSDRDRRSQRLPLNAPKMELMQISSWVTEQYAETYLLTWLLSQWELWWCEGEVYQATVLTDGDRLQAFVENSEGDELIKQVADKLTERGSWERIAISLNRIFQVYRQELMHLPALRHQQEVLGQNSQSKKNGTPPLLQTEFINPYADSLTGLND